MYTFLKELFLGLDPKIADPEMGRVIIKVSDLKKENIILERYIEKYTNNNSSLFRKLPKIKSSKNILYFFSLNYSPTKLDLDREYFLRNLEPANPNLLLKYFLDYRESFKKHSPALSFFKAKKSINYSVFKVYLDKISISIYSYSLDKGKVFDKGQNFFFCGVRRSTFLGKILNFLSFLTAF